MTHFRLGVFHAINHPAIGVTPFMESPIYNYIYHTYMGVIIGIMMINDE